MCALIAAGLLAAGAVPPADPIATIPAGAVLLGEDGVDAPGTRTDVVAFRIDTHEVTNRQFARFVAATGHVTQAERDGAAPVFVMPEQPVSLSAPSSWWSMVHGADWRHPTGPTSGIAGHEDDPVVQVSYDDAWAYARWAGGTLPSAEQWERAARAEQRSSRSALDWIFGPSRQPLANSWQGVFPLRDTGEDGHVGIAPVASYPANVFGVYDMVGNVWEWTSAPTAGGGRLIKGGSFLCAANYCANYRPAGWQAQEHDLGASHIGFRVVYQLEG
ncbi:SUMF1/EgtB/PvdO family nonheme iron enzyme [Sphingomonas sp.]|uniref:SUMF1/EgtB/PvdO family nonheme iron enzyme n=1 Tax=Sphingomonas sp. TaxID=28214 RepID=UPI003B3AB628